MYNPFPILTSGLLASELSRGKRYFVRQFFSRGMDATIRAAFLLRAYGQDEIEVAKKHVTNLIKDPNCFLYDAQNKEHWEKLHIAASQPGGYKVFYAGYKGVEWKPPLQCQQKMKHYLQSRHSDWRTKKGGPKIEIGLCEEFGQLYLELSFGDDHETVIFEVIENF